MVNKTIVISVSSITPGSGLSKYICTLSSILLNINYKVIVLTTHGKDTIYEKDTLRASGVTDYISFGHLPTFVKYVQILKYLHSLHPDIIINNYNGVIQYLLPFLPSVTKIIHILHNNTSDFYRIGSINGQKVSGWIAPTEAIQENFNKYTRNKYKDKVIVIPHGVEDGKPFQVNTSSRKELVFVGVLYEHKGVLILPNIIQKLQQKNENFHFTIIGGGEKRKYLEDELNKEITDGLVSMTGVITPQQVYENLQKADIFVYPTHIDAFGLVIAEAMINGTVPIVTHLKGITDNLIDNNENGYLLKQDDVDSFVEHISLLLHNEELLTSLKLAAKEKAESHFSLEVMKKNYQNYLESLY